VRPHQSDILQNQIRRPMLNLGIRIAARRLCVNGGVVIGRIFIHPPGQAVVPAI